MVRRQLNGVVALAAPAALWLMAALVSGAPAGGGAPTPETGAEEPTVVVVAPEGSETVVTGPEEFEPDLVELARQTLIEQNEPQAWLLLLGCIAAGVLAGWIAAAVVRGIARRASKDGTALRSRFLEALASPISLVTLTMGARIGLSFIRMPEELAVFSARVISFLMTLAAFWVFWNLCGVLTGLFSKFVTRTNSALDNQLVPLLRKTLRAFTVIVFALFVAENVFDADIKGFLAGLGIAGLAVSLAAQDSLRNVLGSITIIADRPFKIGDRIKFKQYDGPVEEIGFRSTRMRTLEGHVVTIPNLQLVSETIENVSLRKCIRRLFTIGVTYDTTPEQLRRAIEIAQSVLKDHEGMQADLPPVVAFDGFGESSLNIQVIYWYHPAEVEMFRGFGMRVNFEILERFNEAGIDFAFPSRTLYVAGDEKRRLALTMLGADLKNGEGAGA